MSNTEKVEYALQQLLVVSTTAAQMAAATALILKTRGALAPSEAEHLAMLSRHLGESFQEHGDDEMASDFGAIAAKLRG